MRTSMAIGAAFLTGLCRMSCQGQEEAAATRPFLFSLPPIKLREESGPQPTEPDPALSNQSTLSLRTEPPAVESTLSYDLHSPDFPRREFHLTRREASSNSSGWGYIDRLFMPEVIRIGKVSVSCPFIT